MCGGDEERKRRRRIKRGQRIEVGEGETATASEGNYLKEKTC